MAREKTRAKPGTYAWKCEVCGLEAKSDQEKKEHLERTREDPRHKKRIEEEEDDEEEGERLEKEE